MRANDDSWRLATILMRASTLSRAPRAPPPRALTRRRDRHPRAHRARASASDDVASLVTLDRALRRIDDERKRQAGASAPWIDVAGARVRAPRGRAWGFVHFVGGAVLGAYPDVAYDALLTRVADACGVVVVATPYELGTDHDAIARDVRAMYSRARAEVCEREGLDGRVAPTFRVGHSLGCKVLALSACEDDGDDGGGVVDVDAASGAISIAGSNKDDATAGYFLVAFNNASASDSVMLIEKFARELLKNRAGAENSAAFDFLKTLPSIASFAERAAKAAGFDFKPSPEDTLARVRKKFSARKTRMLKFTDDELDQNEALVAALNERFQVYPGTVDTREIEGNHLTPVYFTLEGSKLSPALERVVGDFSLGDADGVERLTNALISWILGKD